MRPYLIVILDSFHEAFASRILYILLLALTLVLALVAPLGYTEQRMLQFHRRDIREWPVFIKELRRQAAANTALPGKRIVELAGDPLAKIVKELPTGSELNSGQVNEVVDGLNSLLAKKDLYQEDAWRGVRLKETTQKLLKQGIGNLSQDDLAYLNRLLLRDAFPANLGSIGDKELFVTYAWWTVPEPVPGGKTWFPRIVKATLAAFMDLFVGTVAIFVAILVTAPIIPRTFEPGAIDLLLSKPLSRSLLLIAKYFGGCAYILLSASYFIAGLWLIIGWRLDVWSEKLPLCIPIFMFQFAIYYVVSMLAGVIWKNPIVCVAVTAVFFISCFCVGTGKIFVEQTFIKPNQLVRIVNTSDGVLCVTRSGQFVQWNSDQQSWDDVLQASDGRSRRPMGPPMPSRIIGPIYHQPTQSLLYLKQAPQNQPRRFMGSGSQFMTAKWSGNWTAEAGPMPPTGASWIFQDAQGKIELIGTSGVFAYKPPAGKQGAKTKVLGFEIPLGPADDPFVRLGPPEDTTFSAPYSAAIDPQSGRILIDNEQSLMLMNRNHDGSSYTLFKSVNHDSSGPTLVGLAGSTAVVVSKAGRIQLRNDSSLEVEQTFRPAGNSPPVAVETSADGRHIAVLFQNGRLWLYDNQTRQGKLLDRYASAVAFDRDSVLYSNTSRQVRVRDLKAGETTKVYTPKSETLQWSYRWIIEPIYFVFPKPGELNSLVRSLLIEDLPGIPGMDVVEDLRDPQPTPNSTPPLVHGLIFVLVMLGITCLYVERLDL